MNLQKILAGLLTATFLIFSSGIVQAQNRRSSGNASLGEMGCQTLQYESTSISGSGYITVNQDIGIGREIFRAIGFLGAQGNFFETGGISSRKPLQVACPFSAVKGSPLFKTLSLSFGLSQNSTLIDGSVVVQLTIYLDGNFYAEQTITQGEKWSLPINISGKRSISLEAECVRPKKGENSCPNIWFFQDILKK